MVVVVAAGGFWLVVVVVGGLLVVPWPYWLLAMLFHIAILSLTLILNYIYYTDTLITPLPALASSGPPPPPASTSSLCLPPSSLAPSACCWPPQWNAPPPPIRSSQFSLANYCYAPSSSGPVDGLGQSCP